MLEDLRSVLRDEDVSVRFKPYVSMHEFEALLFSDPEKLGVALAGDEGAIGVELRKVRNAFPSPEHIDDGRDTAPSKRIARAMNHHLKVSYEKVKHGRVAAATVGLDAMLRECPHFAQWVEWLRSR